MILIDTNIIIDYLKGQKNKLDSLINSGSACICGIIVAELFHGINSNNQKLKLNEALSSFNYIKIDEEHWLQVGKNLNHLKQNGINIPFQDAVLATICIEKKLPLYTNDKHFQAVKETFNNLKLYE